MEYRRRPEVFSFGSSSAEGWAYVTTAQGGTKWYLNSSSVIRLGNGNVQCWVKVVYGASDRKRVKKEDNYEAWESKNFLEYSPNRKVRLLEFLDYSRTGEILDRRNSATPWGAVIPDSVHDAILQAILKR